MSSTRSYKNVENGDLSQWQYLTETYDHEEEFLALCDDSCSIDQLTKTPLESRHDSSSELQEVSLQLNGATMTENTSLNTVYQHWETASECLQGKYDSCETGLKSQFVSFHTTNIISSSSHNDSLKGPSLLPRSMDALLPSVFDECIPRYQNHEGKVAALGPFTSDDMQRFYSGLLDRHTPPHQKTSDEAYRCLDNNPIDTMFPAIRVDQSTNYDTSNERLSSTNVDQLHLTTKSTALRTSQSEITRRKKRHTSPLQRYSIPEFSFAKNHPIVPKASTDLPTKRAKVSKKGKHSEITMWSSNCTLSIIDLQMNRWIQDINQKLAPLYCLQGRKELLLLPLTAYNFYYRDERDNIVRNVLSEEDPLPPPVSEYTLLKMQSLLYQHWFIDPTKKKRVHRAVHGFLKFSTLTKVIAERWSQLSNDGRDFYRIVSRYDDQYYHHHLDLIKREHISFHS